MSTERLDMKSPDFVNENYQKLIEIFPNCVTEVYALDKGNRKFILVQGLEVFEKEVI